jgi:hypothetical protein
MEHCNESKPLQYLMNEHQLATCFLHQEKGEMTNPDITSTFQTEKETIKAIPADMSI